MINAAQARDIIKQNQSSRIKEILKEIDALIRQTAALGIRTLRYTYFSMDSSDVQMICDELRSYGYNVCSSISIDGSGSFAPPSPEKYIKISW